MDPFVIRRTVAEKADALPARNRKQKPAARVRYPPVVVCTGLPPLVDGQIRCFAKLTIRRIRLAQLDLSEHNDLVVRVKWWGEPSDGAYFKPICGRKKSGRQITARYAVRCGPKQFAAYLMDAGALTLELLVEGLNDNVLGVANITDVVNLSMQNPVIGWYKMLAITNHKHVADVHVNMSFCELQDIYGESSGTGTGTERSQDESDDSTSQVDIGRTYRVEKGFNENNETVKQNAARVSFQLEEASNVRKENRASNSNSVSNEVDRLIERAELLKLLISPDPGQVPPSISAARRPSSEMDFDADNSLSDTSLIADLFYGKPSKNNHEAAANSMVDSSVQVTPNRTPKKAALRSPDSPPVIRSPGRLEVRRVTSPKVVKFADTEAQKKAVPDELISLLKRVKGATIRVHAIRLSPGDYRQFISGSIPRRSAPSLTSSLSKPPRPLKITFFVHAQLPTGEMCQLTRICGKADLETNIIDFDQSEVIPLTLNDNKISLWFESTVITFRVSCRHASVHRTQPLGISVFSIEPLLFSENFKSRQHVALSTRYPGSTMEMSVDLQIAPLSEIEQIQIAEEKLDQQRKKEALEEKKVESPRKVEPAVQPPTPQPPVQQATTPLVIVFCVSEVEFCDSFVNRMASAASVAQSVSQEVSNRWEVYLTAGAFSQPRRSSSRRNVVMKSPCTFMPKLQLYYVYNLDAATAARFEDNHLVVELRRHVKADEDDQLLAICKVSLHQLFLAFGCDPIATSAVMRSPGPVVTISNEFLPADDPFTLASVARLRCTLAAGSADQIAHFNALTVNRELMPQSQSSNFHQSEQSGKIKDHSRKERSENETSLTLAVTELDQLFVPIDMADGENNKESEADVFVSYQFPTILGLKNGEASRPEVRTFKTPMRPYQGPASTISFGNDASNCHEFSPTTIDSTNLLADLVRSFSFLSTQSSTLGLDFAVSLRLYRPVVRDVIIGYANLSLTRLASLITSTKSAKHRQHIFVRLPITPTGQHHPVGWLTLRLDFSRCESISSSKNIKTNLFEQNPQNQPQFRITVKRAFNLRSAARRLGLKISPSSVGFKTYCALKTATSLITKSECEVSERSFCPVFRTSQFEILSKNSRPEDLEIQLFARDRNKGDLLIGGVLIPATLTEILTRFQPRSPAPFIFPLSCDQSITNSEILFENSIGCVEIELQTAPSSNRTVPATIPGWFQCEPRAKISLFIDKIVLAFPVANFSSQGFDQVFRCRLSIGDSYSSPLSISTGRPQSAVYNEEDVVVIATSQDSIILEHAIPCPPLSEIVDFLARSSAKIDVEFGGITQISSIPLINLLTKQTVPGQFPLFSPENFDFFGSCVYARISVNPLSSISGSLLKDRLLGRSLKKESECFVATVGISRALHLPPYLLEKEVYVVVNCLEPLRTHNAPSADRPIWNFSAETLIPRDLLKTGGLIFRLFTTSSKNGEDDPVIGFTSVDLTSLSLGISQVSGWYHLVDAFGHCLGQILVSIQPIEEVYQPPRPSSGTSFAPVFAPKPSAKKHVDVQTELNSGQTTEKASTFGPGVDVKQLESLSRRIAQLLADPLPPRFTYENATLTLPVTKVPPLFVDTTTETDRELSPRKKVEEKATSCSNSSKSSKSKSSSSSSSSSVKSLPLNNKAESPDSVQMIFEVDEILAGVDESPRPAFVTTVDEQLFAAGSNCVSNPRISVDSNNCDQRNFLRVSNSYESEDEHASHLVVMSPSVLEKREIPEYLAQPDQNQSSPPALEVMSQVSTEEWSQNSGPEHEPSSLAVDDFLAFGGGDMTVNNNNNNDNMSSAEQVVGDFSTFLPNNFDSPHQSSSPVSARIVSARGVQENHENNNDGDEIPAYYCEEQPTSPASTPQFDETIVVGMNNGHENARPMSADSIRQKSRRSPPAWLADANAKLSNALPSFFPHPDSLRSALERVRCQRGEIISSNKNRSADADNSLNVSNTRRPLPTFDVEEARRIARIFASST